MRNMPNMITTARIIFSVILLFVKPLSPLFFTIYIVCGMSDILDGYLARKMKCNTQFGASLDSIADTVFIAVLLIIFIPIFPWLQWMLYWLGAIASLRFVSLTIGFAKYHTLAYLHTYANKATGLALFCFPFVYDIYGLQITIFLIGGIASLSAIEELIIIITSKELNRDIKCIFAK